MRYLIDTNILLFYASDDFDSLTSDVLQILDDYENRIYVSSESVKEAIHLFQNNRIKTKKWKSARDIFSFIENDWGITIDYIQKEHLYTFAGLETVFGHNDPADRLIIAQAITEKMPLISSDHKFELYREYHLDFIYNKR
ncbi:MAG TPA: toxin PIN [Porphyromonadaceae bacterium]|jgi:PIN domain nuclease of toxin-antitoxin system|nr:toxin PIN [Porphyromonadaceae bacterium]HBX21137.1 toxin PIN [Porphyromonadaceae bacterium]